MNSEFQKFSDAMAAAVEKAAESVVSVDARHHVSASGIVWSADGEVLTADHVLQRDDQIGVTLPGGKTVSFSQRPPPKGCMGLASGCQLLKVPAIQTVLAVG